MQHAVVEDASPRESARRSGTFTFRGESIRYVASGSGPAIVCLHNGGTSHRIWDAQIAAFSRSFRVFALDHLGFGESSKPERVYTLPLYSETLGAFLDAQGLRSTTLVGNCLGSATALHYALAHPERVDALVLCNTLTEQTLLDGEYGALHRLFSRAPLLRAVVARILRGRTLPARVQRYVVRSFFARKSRPPASLVNHLHTLFDDTAQLRVLGDLLRGIETFAVLDGVRKPADFPWVSSVWGSENKILRVEGGLAFCSSFQPDRATILEGSGHLPMCEEPDRFNAVLADALAHGRRASRRS